MSEFILNEETHKDLIIFEYMLEPLRKPYDEIRQDRKMVFCDENKITARLVWYLNHNTPFMYLYRRNAVCIFRPKKQYTLDDIYEPDIMIIARGIQIEIESKRIHKENRWSVSEYLSRKRGIGKFLWGVYSRNDHGAMIGYIQKGDFHAIVTKIKTGIKEINCRKCEDMLKIENCVLSVHYRSNKDDIRIYHLFFYFS